MLVERNGQAPEPKRKGPVQLKPGDRLHIMSGGGGGYGDPLRRDPERVARDVRLGYITTDVALEIYAVVCDAADILDVDATRIRRREHGSKE
jgi:N-methylhydantoinase B